MAKSKRVGRPKRKTAKRSRRSDPLASVKTVTRRSKPTTFRKDLARYREGPASAPPTGAIIRNTGHRTAEAKWVEDTIAE